MLPYPKLPLILALKVVFGKLLSVLKLCKKISTMCSYDDGNGVFRGKNYYLHYKIWGFGG